MMTNKLNPSIALQGVSAAPIPPFVGHAEPAHVPTGVSHARIQLKRFIKSLLAIASLPLLLRRRAASVRVLYYHRVNPYPFAQLGPVSRELTITPDVFEDQLRWLQKRGYRSASPEELEQVMAGECAADPKSVVITFDDGFEDNFLWAHPLLVKYGFQGVYFVTTQYVGADHGPDWTAGDQPGCGRFLRWHQIQQMQRDGAVIASHTCSHPMLTQTSDDQLVHELTASRAELTQHLEHDVNWIAYPAGNQDARVRAATRDAGYRLAFTTVTGGAARASDAMQIPRSAISASDSMLIFKLHLAGALDWLRVKEAPGFRRLMDKLNRLLIRRLVTN